MLLKGTGNLDLASCYFRGHMKLNMVQLMLSQGRDWREMESEGNRLWESSLALP